MEYSNDYVRDADTIFFIGTNTDSAATDNWTLYGDANAKTFVHLDIAEAHIGNNFPVDVGLVGDSRATLDYMLEILRT